MAYQTYADWNKSGLDEMFLYVADVVDPFVPIMLFSLFMITLLASYFSSKRFGDGDFAASFAVAGFLTFIVAIIMSLIPGMIQTMFVVITLVVAIIGILFLFFSKRR